MSGSHSTRPLALLMAGHLRVECPEPVEGLVLDGFFQSGRLKQNMPDSFSTIACPEPVEGLSYVYILQSTDGTYYVGQTHDLRERLRKHRLGLGAKHTSDHPGCRLVYWEGPFSLIDAVQREAQLKRWSRAKKEALIRGDLLVLKTLSRSRATPPGQTRHQHP